MKRSNKKEKKEKMLIRIVKMSFEPTEMKNFEVLFERNKSRIRNFKGCSFLELYRGLDQDNIFFTYSYWENEAALDAYRHSEVFKEIWGQTKPLFNAKAEAWSVERIMTVTP